MPTKTKKYARLGLSDKLSNNSKNKEKIKLVFSFYESTNHLIEITKMKLLSNLP